MRAPGLVLCTALLTLLAALAHADDPANANEPATADTPTATAPAESQTDSPRGACIKQCNAAETRCSSQVRRARQECSKRAANAGRDPMTMRSDYAYFCGYFSNPGACGAGQYRQGCQNRFMRTHGLCIDKMYGNIAAMRYDCYLSERDAQGFCRNELRDCRAACGDE